jgi:hypothetical protein
MHNKSISFEILRRYLPVPSRRFPLGQKKNGHLESKEKVEKYLWFGIITEKTKACLPVLIKKSANEPQSETASLPTPYRHNLCRFMEPSGT